MDPDVIIVGAGAAGLATAIFLARARPSATVLLCDGAKRVGAKILVSGGGRCNVTNSSVGPADFYGGNPNVIRRVLAAFSEQDARAFFAELGVPLHEEAFGKLFPDSNQARTVLDALLAEAEARRVRIRTSHRITEIVAAGSGFVVSAETDKGATTMATRHVVLATGGRSLPKTGSDGFGYSLAERLGHRLIPTTPALDPLVLDGGFHTPLSGLAHEVTFTLLADGAKPVRVSGPMLWTHFGLSGPAALDVSRFWNRAALEGLQPRLFANFTGGAGFSEIDASLTSAMRTQPKTTVARVLHTWLPARAARAYCDRAGIAHDQRLGQMTKETRRSLVHSLVEWPVPVVRTRGYKSAEVTAGGIPLSDVNPSTFESRIQPGLFFVGEILDVDGRIGGFNFQWAWSSGFVAGMGIAKRLNESASNAPRAEK